jgi:alpha-1,3-mannosyltransferase
MDAIKRVFQIVRDPKQTRWIAPTLLAADAVLCGFVIWKVPCRSLETPIREKKVLI